ncbi:hypothetical protein NIES4071_110050 (plasmid) [Calothrix sp. NIES-4071]|nr:hypothetical protein NIES4071_110050 [Calothrix sp. NIES-4071]
MNRTRLSDILINLPEPSSLTHPSAYFGKLDKSVFSSSKEPSKITFIRFDATLGIARGFLSLGCLFLPV